MVTCVLVSPCVAQLGPAGRGPAARRPQAVAPQPERFSASGTVEGVLPGKIKLKSTTDQIWIVNVGKGTDVVVKGEAALEVLARGMWIRATMALDRKGKMKDPLSALTVISRKEDTVVGVFPVQQPGGFDTLDPSSAPDPNATTDYDVVGMLTGLKKGKHLLKTQAGNQVVDIEFELAEEAVVTLNIDDYGIAKPGDDITVSGMILQQAQGDVKPGEITGIGNAQSVVIELKEKVVPPQRGRRPQTPKARKTGDEEDGDSKKKEAPPAGQPKFENDEDEKPRGTESRRKESAGEKEE